MSAPYYLRFLRRPSLTGGATSAQVAGAPIIFYTDIISGPNSGAPGGGGCLLSIFGRNFGSNINNIVVTVGGGAVSSNVFLGSAYSDISGVQWLAVQLGASSATGAIKVSVSGVDSNTDKTFTVRSGAISYLSALPTEAQVSAMSPGDFIVVRAGTYDNEIYFHNISGTAGNPLTVMGYPGEAVLIRRTGVSDLAVHTFYSGSNGTQGHFVICGFDCDMGWDESSLTPARGSGIIGMGVDLTDWRVVNNRAFHMFENAGGSAAISGSGTNFKVFGNHCKGNGGSKLYHTLYFDGRAVTGGSNGYELAWNHLERQYGGRAIQFFADASGAVDVYNGKVHHNLIHDICLDGVLFGDRTQTGFEFYDNFVYRTGNHSFNGPATDQGTDGCSLRFNNSALVVDAHDNTFYDSGTDGSSCILAFDAVANSGVTLHNNICETLGHGAGYVRGTTTGKLAASSNNLWHGSGAAPSFDSSSQTGDPLFTSTGTDDFTIQSGSPAKGNGTSTGAAVDDFFGTARPQLGSYDIGAQERTS